MTNKVGGPQEPGKGEELHKAFAPQRKPIEKVEKVKKVDETENEQRARKKFRQYMGDEEEEATQNPRQPSPYETGFYSMDDSHSERSIPDPTHSAPPDVTHYEPEESHEEEALPQSKDFWKNAGALPDDAKKKTDYLETGLRYESPEDFATRQKKEKLAQGKTEATNQKQKKQEKAGIYIKESNLNTPTTAKQRHVEEEAKEKRSSAEKIKKQKKDQIPLAAPLEAQGKSTSLHSQDYEREGGQGSKKQKKTEEIEPPSNTPLPPTAAMAAQTAAVHAEPFLNPEILPLFFQMVGTIYVLSSRPGVTSTEINLDSPAFSSSKFYGAKIILEKYATAPDSFNIRLTGPQAAVTAFNQNIPSLWNAFQKGRFSFRIGRIDAEYAIEERHLFRRKSASQSKDDMGGGNFQGDKHK